jgi:nucleoid-associated protein YgaU
VRAAALGAAWILLGSCAAGSHRVSPPTSAAAAEVQPALTETHASETAVPAMEEAGETTDEPEVEEPDDGAEGDVDTTAGEERPHPLDGWSEERIGNAVRSDLESLGSMAVGNPNAGLLVNGRAAEKCDYYTPVSPGTAWGTAETIDYLTAALKKVHESMPDAPALHLGDISAEHGGPLAPHVSHQSGRDVDIGYFYVKNERWYRRGTAQNLDLAKNWAFVRALVTETDVELILIDHSIQALLRDYALSKGEDPRWVKSLFSGDGNDRPLIRHARGHATHVHVRFFNPVAQETARRSYAALVAKGVVPPVQSFLSHRAKRGDTLGKISKKYGVSVPALRRANRLKNNKIREKRTYLIPIANPRPAPPSRRLSFPPRRLPPDVAPSRTVMGDKPSAANTR